MYGLNKARHRSGVWLDIAYSVQGVVTELLSTLKAQTVSSVVGNVSVQPLDTEAVEGVVPLLSKLFSVFVAMFLSHLLISCMPL